MDIQQIGQQTLISCRERGWAALETAISRPVPEIANGQVRLWYLLYRSQVRLPHQMLYEPFAQIAVDHGTGQIVEHCDIPTSVPPKLLGRYPHAAAASIPSDQWRAIWDELFRLYPQVLYAFGGHSEPGQRAKIGRFAELFALTCPPYLREAYCALNPAIFDWLDKAKPSGR